jgi:DNA helicase-2/ATP-dependent DNA helicase PcrA
LLPRCLSLLPTGGSKFYDRVEVKIVLDYLRVIHQPDNNDAVARILNVPRRGIGDITIKNLVEEAEHARLSLWGLLTKHCRGDRTAKTTIKKAVEQKLSGDLIKTINAARKTIDGGGGGDTGYDLVALVDSLVAQLRLQKYLEDNYPDDHENRWANVREFVTLAGDFARDLAAQGDEDSLPSVDGLAQAADADVLARFLANVSLASDAQTRGGGANDEKTDAVVTISTIHAAKGLEWPVVFVPAVYVGSFPHARSEDHDEERRLLYVAMTRAKAALYLSWPLYAGGPAGGSGQKAELSPFLPPPVVAQFAKKGPLLEKSVVEDMARVLGRDVPAQVDVFAKMPLNAALDDCLFPIDPEENKRERRPWPGKGGGGGGGGGGGDGEEGDAADSSLPPAKRHRTTGGREFAGLDVEFLGEGECLMTMERASEFTFASARARMPGFTTATAHKQALDAAAKAAKAAGAAGAGATAARTLSGGSLGGRPTGPGSRTRLAPDQKTLSGFVRQASGGPPQRTTAAHPPPPQRTPSLPTLRASASNTRTAHPLPQPPAIDPSLAKHRLARGPALPRPPTATKMSKEEEDAEEAALRRSQYAFLSSSPPRPKKEEGGEGGKGKDGDDGEPPLSPAEPSRPLACLHVTTTMMSARERAPQGRPPRPLVPARPSPVERVRKPFKPLTINK